MTFGTFGHTKVRPFFWKRNFHGRPQSPASSSLRKEKSRNAKTFLLFSLLFCGYHESVLVCGKTELRAGCGIVGDKLSCYNRFGFGLDKSLYRTCAVDRAVCRIYDIILCALVYGKSDMLVGKSLFEIFEEKLYYLADIILCQRLIEYYFINPL